MWHQIIYGIKSGMKTANEQNAAPMFFEKHIEPTARTVWKAPLQTRICTSNKHKGRRQIWQTPLYFISLIHRSALGPVYYCSIFCACGVSAKYSNALSISVKVNNANPIDKST